MEKGKRALRFGVHVSVQGGFEKVVQRAANTGCEAFQVFVKSPRAWAARDLSDGEVTAFREQLDALGLGPVVAHASYLLNLASNDRSLWNRSVRTAIVEAQRAERLGACCLVLHLLTFFLCLF